MAKQQAISTISGIYERITQRIVGQLEAEI